MNAKVVFSPFEPSLSGTRCQAIWSGASASGFNLVEDQERIPVAPRFQTACSVTREGLPEARTIFPRTSMPS